MKNNLLKNILLFVFALVFGFLFTYCLKESINGYSFLPILTGITSPSLTGFPFSWYYSCNADLPVAGSCGGKVSIFVFIVKNITFILDVIIYMALLFALIELVNRLWNTLLTRRRS